MRAPKILAEEVLVINLPTRTDRRDRVAALFARESIPFQFAEGVVISRSEVTDDEISEMRRDPTKEIAGWDPYVIGAMGCKRAHIKCLEYGLSRNLESLLVMEDDVDLADGWYERFLAGLSELPSGWLQLYLSALSFRPRTKFSPHLVRLSGACQQTAVLYSRDGMEASLQCLRHARCELDWWMGLHLHPFGCSFALEPNATFQTGGASDIMGCTRSPTP